MKQLIILFITLLSFSSAYSQDSFDFGVFVGESFYIGDVNKNQFFYQPQHTIGGLLRYNISNRYALRGNVTKVKLTGSDLDFSNIYQQNRHHSFSTSIIDFNAQFEFYYLDYSPHDDGYNFTPYISAGIGGAYFTSTNNTGGYILNIPFGAGFRVRLSKSLSAGAQWEFKKNFSDELDGLVENSFPNDNLFDGKQKNYSSDNDWYSYAGIFITITLYKPTGSCHAYGKSYKYR